MSGPVEEGHSRFCTKFGGNSPFRPDNFSWPICEECRTPKCFVCQINIATLPPLLQEQIKMTTGLFQLFYCYECQPKESFADIFIIKSSDLVVPSLQSLAAEKAGQLEGYNLRPLPRILRYFVAERSQEELFPIRKKRYIETEETVMAWNNEQELPYLEAHASQSGIEEEIKREANLTEDQYCDFLDQIYFPPSSPDIKLGGWISWLAGLGPDDVMYLDCPDCKIKMDINFLQIEEISMYRMYLAKDRDRADKWWNNKPGPLVVTLCPKCRRPGLYRMWTGI